MQLFPKEMVTLGTICMEGLIRVEKKIFFK